MLEIKTLLTDIGRITHSAIRRRAFWLNYAKQKNISIKKN